MQTKATTRTYDQIQRMGKRIISKGIHIWPRRGMTAEEQLRYIDRLPYSFWQNWEDSEEDSDYMLTSK